MWRPAYRPFKEPAKPVAMPKYYLMQYHVYCVKPSATNLTVSNFIAGRLPKFDSFPVSSDVAGFSLRWRSLIPVADCRICSTDGLGRHASYYYR